MINAVAAANSPGGVQFGALPRSASRPSYQRGERKLLTPDAPARMGIMQKTTLLLAVSMLAATALAGCTDGGSPTVTSPAGTTPASTTPTSTTPTSTTPTTTPTPGGQNATVTVDDIYVVSLTDALDAAGTVNVCWRVDGEGAIGHTAIHYDTESHPNSTAFGDYDLGAVYPDNGPASGVTHDLPGTFCATIPANETLYLRAHALVPGSVNMLSAEKVVLVDEEQDITFTNFLEVFPATFSAPVCWEIEGLTGTSTHTAVHFDSESHPNATSFAEYDLGAGYPTNTTAQSVNVTLPGEFCTSIDMPEDGDVLYMRAHLILNGTHYLSEERNVKIAPRVDVSGGLPATAAAGSLVNVCWRAEGAGTVAHTALHWDTTSHPEAQAFGEYVGGAVYPNNGPASGVTHELPGPFCANLTMPDSGAIYFRPHTIYPGQELGPEYSIRVA